MQDDFNGKGTIFEDILKEIIALRKFKNHDYGNGFIKSYNAYGTPALFFDMLRKWQRLETLLLTNKEAQVKDETLEDTLRDLSLMCINGIIWLREKEKATE